MYTKDSPAYGGFLDEGMPFVDLKDPLRQIPGSRTNDEDKMVAACAIAELAGGCVSAYRQGDYDEDMNCPEGIFSECHRSLDDVERSVFVGRWMESLLRGKVVSRYVLGQNEVMPRLVNILEADHGTKRKMEEETGFVVEKRARVGNGRDDSQGYRKTGKVSSDEDCHPTTVQNLESPNNDRSRGHSSTIAPSDSSNRESSGGRYVRSAMISSHIPGLIEAHTEVGERGGRFVRTSMRTTNLSPVQWSKNSSDTMTGGSPVAVSNFPPEMLKLHRNAELTFNQDSSDPVGNVNRGSLQSSDKFKTNGEQSTRVKSSPVLAEASLEIGSSSSSTNNTGDAMNDVALRNRVILQHPLFSNEDTLKSNRASEFRQTTPPSRNGGFSHPVHMVTNPENRLPQLNFLPPSDCGVSNNCTPHVSIHERTTGYPAVESPSSGSGERESEERLWSDLEATRERDLLNSSQRTAEGYAIARYNPIPRSHPAGCSSDYALVQGSFHSGSIYGGYNVPVLSPEYFSVAIPFERLTIDGKMPQLQRQTPEPTTGTTYKNHSVLNEVFRRTEAPTKDHPNYKTQSVVAGMCPSIGTREINGRWTVCRREHESKRLHRSKSLSPSMISNLESGNFGALQSIRAYYKTLGRTKPSTRLETGTEGSVRAYDKILGKATPWRLETGTAEEGSVRACNMTLGTATHSKRLETRTVTEAGRCSDSQEFVRSTAGGADVPIDLSSRVRKLEQNDLKSPAKVNNAGERTIDCCWSRGAEISGGNLLQPRSTRSPEPRTTLLTSKVVFSHKIGLDVSESLLQVPSPSISQQGSSLSSPACMPDSHLPPKKRRMPNFMSPGMNPTSSLREVPNASTGQGFEKFPVWDSIPVSGEESLELEARTQLEEKPELPERGVLQSLWQNDGLENLEDVRWAISPDEDGDLPLHIAVARGAESYVRKCVELMSRLGASLDAYDSNRKTALQIAVITSQMNIVEILLKASASPNVLDRGGANSIHLAVKYGELECLKCLLTQSNHVLDLDARNYEGLTALHMAVGSNQLEATRILLRVGASVNVADGKTGQTPLQYAAESNSQQMAKLLLVFGANPSAASYSGYTPAQLASAKSHLEMAKLLERSTLSLSNGTVTTRRSLHVKEQ